jgi:uncharacterized membrane protein
MGEGVINMETTHRSVVKALSWRFIATLITTTLVYAVTGKGEFAAGIGLADTAIKLFIYVGHERIWNRIRFGRKEQQPEYSI